jgi:hypothetical protein
MSEAFQSGGIGMFLREHRIRVMKLKLIGYKFLLFMLFEPEPHRRIIINHYFPYVG